MIVKLQLFLFSILISFSSLSFADDDGTWSYETYETYSLGTSLRLTGCLSSCPGDLVIPSMIGSLSVTAIGESAFGNEQLTSLVFPASIVSIGDNAFEKNELTLVQFKGGRPQLSRSTSFLDNPSLNSIQVCGWNVSGWPGDSISNGSIAIVPEKTNLVCRLKENVNLDINCTGGYGALTDGLLILRSMFGYSGGSLVRLTGGGSCRQVDGSIGEGLSLQSHIGNLTVELDIDRNGSTDAIPDGVLITRYLFGLRGEPLIENLALNGSTFTNTESFEEKISAMMPELTGVVPSSEDLPKHTITGTLSKSEIGESGSTELLVTHAGDEDANFAGLGLRLHFDSSSIDIEFVENYDKESAYPIQILNDTSNYDSDSNTDKYLLTPWVYFGGSEGWLYEDFNSASLYKVNVTAKVDFQGTTLNFSASSTTFGYGLTGNPIYIGLSPDGDEDGVDDVSDNCPAISNPDQIDTDGDDIGNLCDTDDDNDTVLDGDDAFPLDATETVDTDLDGTGNNADTDDDGDGVADTQDAFPLDSTETIDTDSDGTGNNADTDDDGDGVADGSDAFPLDSTETTDTDSDGTGNNADTDDDGDGVADSSDAFPLDSTESIDTDLDGIGNNADNDDDGDGVLDSVDLYPLDASKTNEQLLDIDGNGKVDALTDGLVILRYVFGLRGDVLIGSVVASDATRTSAEEIEAYLATLIPAL